MTPERPRVLIVGLGQVGLSYDAALPETFVYSHARACARHPALDLAGGVDASEGARALLTERYGVPAFAGVASATRALTPDVVIIASPTATHASVLAEVLASAHPRVVLCEKPLAGSVAEGRRMVEQCAGANVALFVNYMRVVEPGALDVGRRITEEWPGPWTGVVWYTKGFRHNASHFWSLAERWFGPVVAAETTRRLSSTEDGDARIEVRAEHAAAVLHYVPVPDGGPTHHGLEAIGPAGRLRYDHGGRTITWEPAAPDAVFAGHVMLTGAVERLSSDFDRFQWHVADSLAAAASGRVTPLCTGAEALASLTRLNALLES